MNSQPTPRPWPENAEPTPEQAAEWIVRCTDAERVETITRLMESSRRAAECFVQDHHGAMQELAAAQEGARSEYERGFRDACDRIQAGIANGYSLPNEGA